LDVANHQSRFDAVDVSRANLNFRLFKIRALSPPTDFSSED
jgi:hypothetical protein